MSDGSIRLGGLASGIDTEGIIKQILAVDQLEVDKAIEEKELIKAKKDTWSDIAAQFKSLAQVTTKLKADGTSGNTLFDNKTVTLSNSDIMTATATVDAEPNQYTVIVNDLADPYTVYSGQQASNWTAAGASDVTIGVTTSAGANTMTVSVAAGDTLQEIADKVNAAAMPGGSDIIATVIDNRLVFQTEDMGSAVYIHTISETGAVFAAGDLNMVGTDVDGASSTYANRIDSDDGDMTINGISVTLTENSSADWISNVTLELHSTGTSVVTIGVDTDTIKSTIKDFIESYNETRDLLKRVREVKLNEEDEFGPFFSDSLLREQFTKLRTLVTGGVTFGSTAWDGTVLANGAGSANDTTIALDGFTNNQDIKVGDRFTISGDTTVYKVTENVTVAGNAASVKIDPPLAAAVADDTAITVYTASLETYGIGTDTSTASALEGILGLTDEGALDSILATDVDLLKAIFNRDDTVSSQSSHTGMARRLYDYIDTQTQISVFISTTRAIDETKFDLLDDQMEALDDKITRLERRMAMKERSLIRQFSEMENAISRSQSAQGSLQQL